ncbi:Slc39a9-prov protein [Operophtera brumata]|uniref:Slc39a9-prov protein n=1 Tax=Operophtera brumata TaxID=104452 RepID=A0A0L7KZY3_OPEBR|nr:Slc39a9-prov protein [Operophtera brumata]
MDGTWVLILLVLVMLVGSYVAGSIPLNVTMSEHLLIFSCAAPLLALLTYFGIGDQNKQTLSDFNATVCRDHKLREQLEILPTKTLKRA